MERGFSRIWRIFADSFVGKSVFRDVANRPTIWHTESKGKGVCLMVCTVDTEKKDMVGTVNALRHNRYINEKLEESDKRMSESNAVLLEHGEFWGNVAAL